ncbi:alpha/beta hydrolase [Halomonas sabkhae]|uniref:alpha/beta fold hydrolase n=1 Tax=Halomonas sabkhae TaxID=626223 RepID=UPI0025B38670|nr:alpha/beta hydrolase [Halomonas sabkhae]MDN3525786.1 alpha/beta hydrolase [Halomonas sabkhae]
MPSPDTAIPLVFAHANGFPGRSYRSFLAPLEEDFDLHPVERLGHHPEYPVGDNWLALRDELLAHLAGFTSPVVGVGHSMGGVLMAMAAEQAPQRFHGVVMLDPPLMLGLDALAMKLAKRLGLVDRVTPAGRSLGRRSRWPDHATMRDYLRRRGLFRHFTDQALDDYIAGGTRELEEGGVALCYDPAIEVDIFRHLPDHLHGLPSRLKVPVSVLAGQDSDLMTPRRRRRLRRHGVPVSEVEGSHMFPMEHPQAARQALQACLDAMLPGACR